jgi:hypothetical protein
MAKGARAVEAVAFSAGALNSTQLVAGAGGAVDSSVVVAVDHLFVMARLDPTGYAIVGGVSQLESDLDSDLWCLDFLFFT